MTFPPKMFEVLNISGLPMGHIGLATRLVCAFVVAEILQRVVNYEEPAFRPSLPEDYCNSDWMALMRVCWIENPVKRPTFQRIHKFVNDCTDEKYGVSLCEK